MKPLLFLFFLVLLSFVIEIDGMLPGARNRLSRLPRGRSSLGHLRVKPARVMRQQLYTEAGKETATRSMLSRMAEAIQNRLRAAKKIWDKYPILMPAIYLGEGAATLEKNVLNNGNIRDELGHLFRLIRRPRSWKREEFMEIWQDIKHELFTSEADYKSMLDGFLRQAEVRRRVRDHLLEPFREWRASGLVTVEEAVGKELAENIAQRAFRGKGSAKRVADLWRATRETFGRAIDLIGRHLYAHPLAYFVMIVAALIDLDHTFNEYVQLTFSFLFDPMQVGLNTWKKQPDDDDNEEEMEDTEANFQKEVTDRAKQIGQDFSSDWGPDFGCGFLAAILSHTPRLGAALLVKSSLGEYVFIKKGVLTGMNEYENAVFSIFGTSRTQLDNFAAEHPEVIAEWQDKNSYVMFAQGGQIVAKAFYDTTKQRFSDWWKEAKKEKTKEKAMNAVTQGLASESPMRRTVTDLVRHMAEEEWEFRGKKTDLDQLRLQEERALGLSNDKRPPPPEDFRQIFKEGAEDHFEKFHDNMSKIGIALANMAFKAQESDPKAAQKSKTKKTDDKTAQNISLISAEIAKKVRRNYVELTAFTKVLREKAGDKNFTSYKFGKFGESEKAQVKKALDHYKGAQARLNKEACGEKLSAILIKMFNNLKKQKFESAPLEYACQALKNSSAFEKILSSELQNGEGSKQPSNNGGGESGLPEALVQGADELYIAGKVFSGFDKVYMCE
ncbi:hypothetical protein Ddc_23399 [Ditylenchus destructor]|nr:hypothetical protein Ddc_23399 [Ditylenchus destructor]